MALVRPPRPLPGADGRVAQSAIIIALVLQHLPSQLLPKLNLGRRRLLEGACLGVVSVDLRQAKEESKLPVLPALSPPRLVQANGVMPPAVVIIDPVFRSVVA